jgi:hypothetical protein
MNLKVHGTTNRSGYADLTSDFAHLSEGQIDDQLIGDPAAAAAAHLAGCELCVSRVAQAAAPIEAFNAVTLAWSERRSATMPLHQALARSASFHPRFAWAAAVAAALAVGVAMPVVSHQSSLAHRQETAQIVIQTVIQTHPQIQPVAAATNDASAGPGDQGAQRAEIVRDNQMLQAIDRELDAASESPESLGLKSVSGAAAHKFRPPSSVQD